MALDTGLSSWRRLIGREHSPSLKTGKFTHRHFFLRYKIEWQYHESTAFSIR